MKKRMNKDERQAIINLVIAKAKALKTVEIEAKLVKEKSYLEWKKLNNEIKKLEEKKKLVNTKIWGIQNELNSKYNCYINFGLDDKLNINDRNSDGNNYYMKQMELHNKLVLMGIEGIDVNAMIDELVKEYIKK